MTSNKGGFVSAMLTFIVSKSEFEWLIAVIVSHGILAALLFLSLRDEQ